MTPLAKTIVTISVASAFAFFSGLDEIAPSIILGAILMAVYDIEEKLK